MYHYTLVVAICLLAAGLSAQTETELPRTQWSFGSGLWLPLVVNEADVYREVRTDYTIGHSLDVEARRSRWFSYVLTLGVDRREGVTSWGVVPINTDLNLAEPEPAFPETRSIDHVDQQFRRIYGGVGGQVNVRLGQGDLSMALLATAGQNRLTQTVSFGQLQIPLVLIGDPVERRELGPSGALDRQVYVTYRPILQAGARGHLQYTYWISRGLAVRMGGYLNVHQGRLSGDYVTGSESAYQVKHEGYPSGFDDGPRLGIEGNSLPRRAHFVTPSPTALQLQGGLHFGIICKPGN